MHVKKAQLTVQKRVGEPGGEVADEAPVRGGACIQASKQQSIQCRWARSSCRILLAECQARDLTFEDMQSRFSYASGFICQQISHLKA